MAGNRSSIVLRRKVAVPAWETCLFSVTLSSSKGTIHLFPRSIVGKRTWGFAL